MRNKILAVVAAVALSGNVFANVQLDENTFRTGTCGGTMDAQNTCVSMGIDMETGKVYKSTSTNDSDIWNGKNVEEIGQFATVDTIGQEVTDALDERITVLEENADGETVIVIEGTKGDTGDTGATGQDGADGRDGRDGNTTHQSTIISENEGVKTLGSYTSVNGSDEHSGAIDSSVYNSMTSNGVSTTKVTSSEVKQCTADSNHSWCEQGSDSYVELTTETLRVDLVTEQELDEVQNIVRDNSIAIDNLENSKVDKNIYEADQERQDQALSDVVDAQEVKDSVQDSTIANNTTAISETNIRIDNEVVRLEDEIELGDAKTLEAANTYTDTKVTQEAVQREAADVQLASQISNEALVRAEQDAITLAEAQLYADTGIQRQALKQAKVDQVQDSRITKNEQNIAGLQQDVAELNGIVAGTLAASTFEMPMDWNGDWAVQAGIGGYKGANALALGVVTAGEGYAIRATVTGSDADDFSELAYGASVTISTKLFD